MDAADRDLFERTIAAAVGSAGGPTGLDAALHDLGWLDALTDDEQAAVSVLFEQLGRHHATSAALDHLVARALAGGAAAGAEGGIVLPALGRTHPPGRLDGTLLHIRGLASPRLLDQESALVPTTISSGPASGDPAVLGVVMPVADLTLRPIRGLDPGLRLVEVTGELPDVEGAGAPELAWQPAVSVAQLAIGHELVGASRTMLDLARSHATERVQFGQPIARFQAIRHRLADTLVAIESAEAVLAGAWEDRSPVAAAMAKAVAGRAARTTARHCQQVLAGLGFTTEHPLHLSIRRAFVLDDLLGSSRSLTASLGEDLIETRQLPPLLPL